MMLCVVKEVRTYSSGGVNSIFTKAGETVESLWFHLFQPAPEDRTPRVITGASASISTQPLENVNATPASTGRRVSCAGQGDLGLTVSVRSTHCPVLLPVQLCAPFIRNTVLTWKHPSSPLSQPPTSHLPALTCFFPSLDEFPVSIH